ncbi:AsnC family transcriptional regulator [Candidatus Lokiarchaeum ossiferum]|uniref:AsnC family transcriptional regulator n=1 Tax=Candidatus Lokiarchaeum ossiferum TaxID=2951803 RepID=UPI00352ED00D
MDRIDLQISKYLLINSRQSYREIAENLEMSINSIHKRTQNLIDSGIIQRFRTIISLGAFSGIEVIIFGKTSLFSLNILKRNLIRDDHYYWVTFGAGNLVYIGAYLHSINELSDVVAFAKNAGDLSDVIIGIVPSYPVPGKINDLDNTDLQIIRELQFDSRKKASEISSIIGVSAKTINKRISNLSEQFLVHFTIDWIPNKKGDILAYLHLTIDDDYTPAQIESQINANYGENNVYCTQFSNLPNFLFSVWWVDSFEKLSLLRESIQKINGIKQIEINMMYNGVILETWRDKYLHNSMNL